MGKEDKDKTRKIDIKIGESGEGVIFKTFLFPWRVAGKIADKITTISRQDKGRGEGLDDISHLRQLLSNEKARILHAIRTKKPSSLYRLAKILNRDFKSVREDAELLKKFGFIRFVGQKKGKRYSLRPEITVEKLELTIHI